MMSASDLARKLGLMPGRSVCLLEASPSAEAIVRAACPPGVALVVDASDPGEPAHDMARCDVLLFWPRTLDSLTARLATLQACIAPDGALWIVIPKRAHMRARGVAFTWEEMQSAALGTDLVDNKIASFSDTDYATRFVIRKERRGAYR